MADDPNLEWLGHVQPVGLVVAPRVLTERGLVPAEQTRADTEEAETVIPEDGAPADPWAIATTLLGWQPALVAGAPGGPELPDDLSAWVPEAETRLAPDWAVQKPGGGWQLLVQVLPPGKDPDGRGALAGWEATPHQRLERLLREVGIPIGLLISGDAWRLVYAPRGETSGWLRFPLAPLRLVAGRPMLGGLKLLLARFRLFNDAEPRRLPALLQESRAAQAAVSATLASQVLGALHDLLRGFNAADPERMAALARTRPDHVYEGLLTVLLRLVFLLYAEDRDLIPSRNDAAARGLYARGYDVRGLHARLLDDAAKNPDTMNERTGAWGRLLALFRLVHTGDGTGWIRGRGGALFDPEKFPFLQGQDAPNAPVVIPRLSDGIVLHVLDRLLVLGGERLSYRTLDVEQIGSVYETVMGFSVFPAPGPSLAIAAGKNNRTPVFVDLQAVAALRGKDRVRALKEEYSRAQLSAKQTAAIEAAQDEAALADALRPLVDERGSPGATISPSGTPLLQPTDERRRTGSHYTPRDLTHPIVLHALEPAFERIGADATAEDVLALNVCDPSMGSGAFLVEACRQIASLLVAAWAKHPGSRPSIPPDEDEELLARRLVAQRCLYGVDRNPLAVDLARLSLWLATLARDHEFTFLDHALKSGDSLVGLTRAQIGALTWGDDRQGSLFGRFVSGRLEEAMRARAEIRDAPDDVTRAIQEARHALLESRMADVRALGDAVLAAFFGSEKPRARLAALHGLQDLGGRAPESLWPEVRKRAAALRQTARRLRPFHWEIEFPEVFLGKNPGFSAIIGNPPFLGVTELGGGGESLYSEYLRLVVAQSGGKSDLCAFFFRRAFEFLARGASLGLLATKAIAEGDSRRMGLVWILKNGGQIYNTRTQVKWPGEAAVFVSSVHIVNGSRNLTEYNGIFTPCISSFLLPTIEIEDPVRLHQNANLCFLGIKIYGAGFIFGKESRQPPMEEIATLQKTEERRFLRAYIGGQELNTIPSTSFPRTCIGVCEIESEEDLRKLPNIYRILAQYVLPERRKKAGSLKTLWWKYGHRALDMQQATRSLEFVIVKSRTSNTFSFRHFPNTGIFNDDVVIFSQNDWSFFGLISARTHEVWVRWFSSSSMDNNLRYTPTTSFLTFPMTIQRDLQEVKKSARDYADARDRVLVSRGIGLTPHSSPHFVSESEPQNSPLCASISANLCISGRRRCSGMFGICS